MSKRFFDTALKEFNISLQEVDCKFIFNKSDKFKTKEKLKDTYIDIKLSSGNLTLCYEVNILCPMYIVPKFKELLEVEKKMEEMYQQMALLKENKDKTSEIYNNLKEIRNKRDELADKKYWNLISIDNMDVLKEFIHILKEYANIDLNNKVEPFETTAKLGLKENFNKYGSMYKKLEELFTMNEGEYDIGDADSITAKEGNTIYMKDTQHPVFFKVIKEENNYTLYINHEKADPDNHYSDLENKEKLNWEKLLLLKENDIEISKIYFNELSHLKYLVEPTLGQEALFTKSSKLKM